MHVTLVHIHVTPENREAFIAATRANHEASVQEPGNLRFDVLQSPEDPGLFHTLRGLPLRRMPLLTRKPRITRPGAIPSPTGWPNRARAYPSTAFIRQQTDDA